MGQRHKLDRRQGAGCILEAMRVAREFRCLFTLLVVACLTDFPPAHAQSSGILAVTVIDNRGFPVSSAALTLVSDDRIRSAKLDRTGKFDFTNLPFQTYELEIWSPSFKDVTLTNIQITSREPDVLTIALELYSLPPAKSEPITCTTFDIDPIPGIGRTISYEDRANRVNFSGSIADVFSGKLLEGATITLSRAGSGENSLFAANSNDKGEFEFTDLEPGKYTFVVSRKGYLKTSKGPYLWITRENLTRVGNILMFPASTQDLCGMGVIETPERNPVSIPAPELIPPK
jgi:hypothetical protein